MDNPGRTSLIRNRPSLQRARPRRMHTPTDGLYHGLESCLGLVQPKVQGLTGPGWWRLSPACYR